MKIRKWIGLGLFLAGIGFLTAFFLSQHKYSKTNRLYQNLQSSVEQTMTVAPSGDTSSRIDFAFLTGENPDTRAWLRVPAIDLSLPVVQGEDDQYYLHLGFDGEESPCGCLFLSAGRNTADAYNVIFGHNLANGTMFGKLVNYRKQGFGQEAPEFYLYTPEGDYRCKIFSCHEDTDSSDTYNTDRILTSVEYGDFLAHLKAISLYEIGPTPTASDRVLTLSTCSDPYSSGLKRFVVHAVLEEMK